MYLFILYYIVERVFDFVKERVAIREDFKTRSFGELHKQSTNKAENRKVTIYYILKKDLHRENEILGIKPEVKKREPLPLSDYPAIRFTFRIIFLRYWINRPAAAKAGIR